MSNHNTKENIPRSVEETEQDTYSFHVVLLSESDDMYDLWLPSVPEGFFRIADDPEFRFLSILAKDRQWVATCKKPAFFRNMLLAQSNEVPLSDEQVLAIDYEERGYSLYVEKVFRKQMVYHNYAVYSDIEITIGSHPGNVICYDSPYVSRNHAILRRQAGKWSIHDCNSVYGVYVNKAKCTGTVLKTGDVVSIMGLKIMIGPNLLAINDGIGKIRINQNVLQALIPTHGGPARYAGEETEKSADVYFNRLPRKRTEMEPKVISVEGPPMSMDQKKFPMLLRMGSSLVMGGTAALAGNFMSLITSVMFPFLSSKYTDKQRQDYERLRTTKYTEYLENKRKEIAQACLDEKVLLNQKYPDIRNVIDVVDQRAHLWERRPMDSDFLSIRLGTGTQPLLTTIDYPPRRFELEPDELEGKMYQLVESPHYVDNVPIVLPMMDTRVCGLLGPRDQVLQYIQKMVFQIAAFHSYDEVKIVFFLGDEELKALDDIRYIPHSWDDQRTVRFVATDEAGVYRIGEYIKNQISGDKEDERDAYKLLRRRPFYVIFALDKKLFEGHEVFRDILHEDGRRGISILAAYNDLPKESQKIITLDVNGKNVCTTMAADGGEDALFRIDTCDDRALKKAMRTLANTKLKTDAQAQEMPKMITFLEMFQTGRIEQLNPLKRWQENNPVKSLATPVGVATDGSLFTLDLHEKRQGPHGLVAGMTGSGKSEFIITYILSMAINYHPDEVAFVLIDYKGGGLAGAFDNPQTGVRLPHLAGTITNLDGSSIQRSLMSIESELLRRQRIFNDIKSVVNEGTMDIYAYQKLYRAGKVSEPMPHLFIISDEFAELKQQQPEFMAKLISAARIGRSLGVHLILATQKPTGVVDDQIRSNTKFRVCLRVQERSDSMDMLKRPEAAELTDTGRFYLQVGYNEFFALGQSAWCGANYEPQDTVIVRRDDAVDFLDITGQIVAQAKPKFKKTDSGKKQIVAVVEYLSNLAQSRGISVRQLCPPELPKNMDLNELRNSDSGMSVCLGKLDDPENQEQYVLNMDFERCSNMLIIGDSSSGKTTMVQNILYSLTSQLPPSELNFYALDYSSRMLKLFAPLPHCGAILQEEDSAALDEFFKLINKIVAERKQLYSELEVDSFEAAREKVHLPLIVVIIDNISGMNTTKQGEAHNYKLPAYLKNSANYGVKYILTCGHLNEASSRIRQEVGERICLHMKDKYDYSEVLGCKVSYIPPQLPGRGLVKWMDRPLEFQSAIICADVEEKQRLVCIKELVEEQCRQQTDLAEVRRLPVYSETATYEEFSQQFKRGRIPLGCSRATQKPVALPLKQFSGLSVFFGNAAGVRPITENFLYAARREHMEAWIVKRSEESIFDKIRDKEPVTVPENATLFSPDAKSLQNFRTALTAEVTARKALTEAYCNEQNITGDAEAKYKKTFDYLRENTKPILVILESFADFCGASDLLSTLMYDKLFTVARYYNIYVIGYLEPDDHNRLKSRTLYHGFNEKAKLILLGGQFDKQIVYPFEDTSRLDLTLPYNAGLMHYQQKIYPLVIPCGKIDCEELNEDEQSIF